MLKLVVLLLFSTGQVNSFKVIEHRTLKRDIEHIIITPSGTPLAGSKISDFRLFACSDGKLIPIPFQVDERKNNRYLLPDGPEGERGNGIFDDQDELVFMVKDTGDRCRIDAEGKWLEIEVIDPVDGGRGWVYLTFNKDLPLSEERYVWYYPEEDSVATGKYFLQFNREHPIFFDTLGIKEEAGGSGKNMIDRLKIRFYARLTGGFISIHKNEEDFRTKLLAYHAGKVRLIRLTRNWQTLFWKIPTPAADIFTIFYDNSFEFPVVVDLPFDVGLFLKSTDFRVSIDMRKEAGRRLFYNSRNTVPVEINGVPSPEKEKLDRGPFEWMVNAGVDPFPAGWFNVLEWSAPGNPEIGIRLYFEDDVNKKDPPENQPGEYGDLGYSIVGLEHVKKGKILIRSVMYWFEKFKPGDEKRFINVDKAPLRVRVSSIR